MIRTVANPLPSDLSSVKNTGHINNWEKVLWLSNNLHSIATDPKQQADRSTCTYLEDLSNSLLSEVQFHAPEQDRNYNFMSNTYHISPFALPTFGLKSEPLSNSPGLYPISGLTNPIGNKEGPLLVKTTYKEPSPKVPRAATTAKAASHPYEKLANRKRRQRKGKVVHGRKEKQCDWCKTTQTPEWRTGPQFTTLCNACGLQFRKFNRMEEEQENRGRNAIKNVLNNGEEAKHI